MIVSTHSRPKAAGIYDNVRQVKQMVSTHSRPKAAGNADLFGNVLNKSFQHTAARRRLDRLPINPLIPSSVSTHSRPKAAG